MAVATFYLALNTRSMADKTKEVADATLKEARAVESEAELVQHQVSISTEALRVSIQPWLVWEPYFDVDRDKDWISATKHGVTYINGRHPALAVHEEDSSVVGWFTLRNVGNGMAIVDMSKSRIYRQNGDEPYVGLHPSIESPVVPPGGLVDLDFTIPASMSADHEKMTIVQLAGGAGHQLFTVEVVYGDSLGSAGTSAKFKAHRQSENSQWSIFEVEYRLDGGREIITRKFG
jgi:hypothetical protein